jgi:hypothetical protein
MLHCINVPSLTGIVVTVGCAVFEECSKVLVPNPESTQDSQEPLSQSRDKTFKVLDECYRAEGIQLAFVDEVLESVLLPSLSTVLTPSIIRRINNCFT